MATNISAIHNCNNVANFPLEKFFQRGSGHGKKILIVGESPAMNGWVKSGRAFYTVDGRLLPSGRNLNILLKSLDLSVDSCGFTELVKCVIGKERKLISECGKKCWPIFVSQLEADNFKLIITLGLETLKVFNQLLESNLEVGRLTNIQIGEKKYLVLPLFHPSPISPYNHRRNLQIMRSILEDLKRKTAHKNSLDQSIQIMDSLLDHIDTSKLASANDQLKNI